MFFHFLIIMNPGYGSSIFLRILKFLKNKPRPYVKYKTFFGLSQMDDTDAFL